MNKEDFKVLENNLYLDNACMTLMPTQVLTKINEYYTEYPACGGRSMHWMGRKVSEEVKDTRKKLSKFFGAKDKELIFTKNTTESINLVANSLEIKGKVLQTDKEHNSCLLPFQNKGILTINTSKGFDFDDYKKKLKEAKLVAMQHSSNLDGTTILAKEIIKEAHKENIPVLLDGAQYAPHHPLNLKKLDVDFYALSSHKMLGPSLGLLYAKTEWHDKMKAFMIGGGTVTNTSYSSKEFEEVPQKFEAGLQNYAGIIGFKEAIKYLDKIGMKTIEKKEKEFTETMWNEIQEIEGLQILGGEPEKRGGITSFYIEKKDPHQIALLLDQSTKIQVRSGQHCVHSWFNKNKIEGTVRASAYLYNDKEDAIKFSEALKAVLNLIH